MKLSAEGKLRLAVKFAFLAGAGAAMTQSVYAQEAAAPAAEESTAGEEGVQLESLTVTGSRIKQPALTSVSPVTTVGAEEITYSGTTRVEDLLNSLPQVFAGQGANVSNGATGTATVDLRGLGSQRTLVLIDGKRMLPGDPASPVADLNFIPAALVEKIDVSTGGASAVYGSDAVAGVVNFVMKRDFEGFSIDVQRSGYWHDNDDKTSQQLNADRSFSAPSGSTFDGQGWDITTVLGMNTADGKGNATVYATYRQIDAITEARRDYSNCTLTTYNTGSGYGSRCGGSFTSYPGLFVADGFADFGYLGTIGTDPTTGEPTFRAFDTSTDLFNYAPYNYYQRNDERYGMGAFAHYELNKHADVYTDIMYMSDRTNAVIAPSGAFGSYAEIPCNGSNPLVSATQLDILCAPFGGVSSSSTEVAPIYYILRRNVEGGGRDDDLTHQSQRVVIGSRGEIVGNWTYDAYAQYGQSTLAEIYRNDFSNTRLARALDVVDDGSGNAVCRSVLDGSDPNCVPWNIWSPGGVTQEALDYLQTPGLLQGHTEQRIASFSVAGDLGEYGVTSPWAVDGVGIALGTEYRHEQTIYEPDTAFETGDLAGQGGATIGSGGAFHVKELFGELRLPIAQGKPFVEELNAELGYRLSDYSSLSKTADTYKIGVNYAPIKDVALRGGFNRAIRAPSILEIGAPTRVALDGSSDPCAGSSPDPGCVNDPLYATNPDLFDNGLITANPASQYNGLLGTSPGLKEEKADTYTYGFVFTPTFLKGYSLTIDYYDIKVDGLISGYGADNILNTCYTEGLLCDLIVRNPSNGSLWQGNGYVIDTTTNTGSLQVKGFDVTSQYKTPFTRLGLPDIGTLTVDLVATRAIHYTVEPIPGGSTYDCVGLYGNTCGTPTPEWRGKLRTTWGMPWYDSKLSLQWRYFHKVDYDGTNTAVTDEDLTLGSQSYIDLYASTTLYGMTFEAGINNLFDREPPLNSQGLGNGNTFSQVYDSLGSYVFGGVHVEF